MVFVVQGGCGSTRVFEGVVDGARESWERWRWCWTREGEASLVFFDKQATDLLILNYVRIERGARVSRGRVLRRNEAR